MPNVKELIYTTSYEFSYFIFIVAPQEEEEYDFVVHPETHKNIKPEEHFNIFEDVGR